MNKILIALALSVTPAFAATNGIEGPSQIITVTSMEQDGAEGASVQICEIDTDSKAVTTCQDLGSRGFYTWDELDAVKAEIAETGSRTARKDTWIGIASGAFLGAFGTALLVPHAYETTIALIPVAVGAALQGYISGTQARNQSKRITKIVNDGLSNEESVTVSAYEFDAAVKALKQALN
jgi:hypothetical protein